MKIIEANARNQFIENLMEKGINMLPESGNMFLKEELTKRGCKILSSFIFKGGFNIDVKSPEGDIISLRITNILSREAQYSIWDSRYNLIADCIVQYMDN